MLVTSRWEAERKGKKTPPQSTGDRPSRRWQPFVMGNMGKLQEFDITFKDNKVVYSPGDAVSGTLKITTAQALLFKGNVLSAVVKPSSPRTDKKVVFH